MVCSDEDEFSYDGSYFEEVVELSDDEEEEDDDDDDHDDTENKKGNGSPQDKEITTGANKQQPPTPDQGLSTKVIKVVGEPPDESESYVEEDDDDEYIIEEFVEESYEVPLAGSASDVEDNGEDETTFDDNSTAYNPDDDEPIITDEAMHRQSTSTELEIGKYSDHSMDVDNTFELTLPFIPKSKQMSAVTLDWDIYQDSTSSWGGWGSDEESDDGNGDMADGGRPIIYMDEHILETAEEGTATDGPKRGVTRNKSTGKLVRRPSLQKAHSGGLQPRGSLSRNNSGNLRGAIDRTNSGGLMRPMPSSFVSTGVQRRKSHGHLIIAPLDTLAEEVTIKEDGATQLSPVANDEDHIKLSRETLSSSETNQLSLPPPLPPIESDDSLGSSQEFGDESHELAEKKDANSAVNKFEGGQTTNLPTIDQTLANQQKDGHAPNQDLPNIPSITIKDGALPRDYSTNATYAINKDYREGTLENAVDEMPLSGNATHDDQVSNFGQVESPSKDSIPDEVDSPPLDISVTGVLENGSDECHRKGDEDTTGSTNSDRIANTTASSKHKVRNGSIPKNSEIQSPPTKPGIQNPVTPSPSGPYPSPASSTKKSRSIDQLRRSNHLNMPGVSNHSQLSLPRRASKRSVTSSSSSPGMNSEVSASPKTGKVSRFEQLLKRSSAIKGVR